MPPEELMDQHLMAELHEIKRLPSCLQRSIKAHTADGVTWCIPEKFCLGAGHVMFFYNKGAFLLNRHEQLITELKRRGFKINATEFDPDGHMLTAPWDGNYTPDAEALHISRARIAERIAVKPEWYRRSEYVDSR